MEILYCDTSALVKRYIVEDGTAWIKSLFASPYPPLVFISQLAIVESICAFSRRQREGSFSYEDYDKLLAALNYDINSRYITVDITQLTIDTACRLAKKHPLRAYDAVHLATVYLLNRELVRNNKSPISFICADERLISIAQAENLITKNPNHYKGFV
jgi:uncharacterized protein